MSQDKNALLEKARQRKAARTTEKAAEAKKTRYAKLREVAAKEPRKAGGAFEQLAAAAAKVADGLQTLRANLSLVDAPRTADLKTRIAARRNYGSKFRQIADESPEVLENAFQEIWQSLDEIAAATESLADNLGLSPERNTQPELEDNQDLQNAFDEFETEDEKEASDGANAFVTDRDETGKPKELKKVEIPRAQGSSEQNK